MNPTHSNLHTWRFYRSGGFDQVRLDTLEDLVNLDQLDQKLWVALSCPSKGLQFDPLTLAALDHDNDGYIRASELVAALKWTAGLLNDPLLLLAGAETLPLSAINANTAEGLQILAAAKNILTSQGKPDDTHICCADTQFSESLKISAWQQQPALDPGLSPLGESSGQALSALQAVSDKINDYFTRCRLASFDPRASVLLNASDDDIKSLTSQNLAADINNASGQIAALPLATVTSASLLPLNPAALNPAWSGAMQRLLEQVITPLLGEKTSLAESEWQEILTQFSARQAWAAEFPQAVATPFAQAVASTVSLDEVSAEAIANTDRLVRYTRDLTRLARNFVSFQNFYGGTEKALFQAGTLYLDGRSCDLCIEVLDPAKHATLATLSGIYLAYCDCIRSENNKTERMSIAAAFTAGDSDQLIVGRNGLFYDRQGRDWHATISKIIDHPISLNQSFWSPYKKLVRMMSEQVQKLAAAKNKVTETAATNHLSMATQKADSAMVLPPAKPATAAAPPAPAMPAVPFDVAKFAGIFAAIGLAVGALGTALATLLHSFLTLSWWQMPFAIGGIMLMISGPAVVLAWFKLRNRNLGPLLDANGWAVNTRAKINIPFGRSLTKLAALPAGAERSLHDPYAEKNIPWLRYGILSGIVAGALIYLRLFWH